MVLHLLNFRDLGGLKTANGEIRAGTLYRSEGPANFADEHQDAIAALGIRNIIDLRSAQERDTHPHGWQREGCRWRGLDVNADLRVFGNDGRDRLLTGSDERIAIDIMVETYREIADALFSHWAEIGEILLDGPPALINCTAGKDRTGVAVAVILEMLGVARDDILRDYQQSRIFGDNIQRSGTLEEGLRATFGFVPSTQQVDALIGVRPEYLSAAWERIEQRSQSVPRYLEEAGLPAKAQAEIRRLLTTEGAGDSVEGERT